MSNTSDLHFSEQWILDPPLELGFLAVTQSVYGIFLDDPMALAGYLKRHRSGDWGNVPPEDAVANNRAVATGERVVSSYMHGATKIWIITEADRSVTTVLLPEEY